MVTEANLKRIGFRGFTFGRKEDRDGFKRLIWVGEFFTGELVTVRLICICCIWEIDFVKVYDEKHNEITPDLYKGMMLEDILGIVEKSGTNDFLG